MEFWPWIMNVGNASVRSIMNVNRSFEISVYISDFLCFKAVLLRWLFMKRKKLFENQEVFIKKASLCFLLLIYYLGMLLIVKFFLKEVHMYKLAIEEKNQLTKYRSNRVP